MGMPKKDAECQRCGRKTLLGVQGKCSDMFTMYKDGHYKHGYVQGDLNVGSGDYMEFIYCTTCGQIQGKFPLKKQPEVTKDWIKLGK